MRFVVVLGVVCAAATAAADAPRADEASGIAVAAPIDSHPVANAFLFVPRELVVLALSVPRVAAEGVDAYLTARSPNLYARDTHSSWRAGGEVAWETRLGPSLALRLGYELAPGVALDAYGGAFGPRGESGGAIVSLGNFGGVAPRIRFDTGRDLSRTVAIEDGPRMDYHARGWAVTAAVPARFGAFVGAASAGVDSSRADGDELAAMRGADEREHALTAELAIGIDTRRPAAPYIAAAEPSRGTLVRAAAAYVRGDATDSGDFATGRFTLEAKQLLDVFHGDRVLTIGAWAQALSSADVPFDRLPALGGPDRMRAFARDELRARTAAAAELEYAWPLGNESRAYVFVEGGAIASVLRADGGGGVRFVAGPTTWLRLQVAGASTGDVGFLVMLGAL
ncbi:MAG TPA: hypothetical protein VGM88_10830 [Kofleriaceae bacterium]|jgi:hypothetical protein